MTYNIEESGSNPNWINVLEEENPDIAVLVETGDWDNNNNELLYKYCQQLNEFFIDEDPYECKTTQDIPYSTSGETILSRYSIDFTVQIPMVTLDDGSSYSVSHDFFHIAIQVGDSVLNVIAAHLKCCGGSENEAKREKQQEGIINYFDQLGDVPLIYAGDLNSFSPEDTQNKGDLGSGPVSMLLGISDYTDQKSDFHSFTDVFRTLHPDNAGFTYGHQNTLYESRIDFIFANQYVSDDIMSSTTGDTSSAKTGSDHFSVDVVMDYDPQDKTGDRYTGSVSSPVSSSTIEILWTPLISSLILIVSIRTNKRELPCN